MKWTADAAVLQNVDFSSQFVKWIRDGTALCQTKVATNHPLNRIMKQLQPIVQYETCLLKITDVLKVARPTLGSDPILIITIAKF